MNKRTLAALLFLFSLPVLIGKARQQSIHMSETNELLMDLTDYAALKLEDEFESEMVIRCFTYTPDDIESPTNSTGTF